MSGCPLWQGMDTNLVLPPGVERGSANERLAIGRLFDDLIAGATELSVLANSSGDGQAGPGPMGWSHSPASGSGTPQRAW